MTQAARRRTNENTASDVSADTAYRSQSNEAWLGSASRVSRVRRNKPRGRLVPARKARANAAKSTIRARIAPADTLMWCPALDEMQEIQRIGIGLP